MDGIRDAYLAEMSRLCIQNDNISKDFFKEFGVKAGLRDESGKGVLAGLTNISDIKAFEFKDGKKLPATAGSFIADMM